MAFNNPNPNPDNQLLIYNKFEWYYKNEFNWAYISHNESSQRTVFLGIKDDLDYATILKSIKVFPDKYKTLLKEAYFLACVKSNKYFAEIIDLFTSDNCDNMYIIMRDEGTDLQNFIQYIKFDYNEKIENISRFIIFQTVCGLKVLHEKGLSHNDIKLGNIVISGTGKTKICDLGSTSKNETLRGGGTNGYLSLQAILGKNRTKEDDMYAVGIVFLELLNRKIGIFKVNNDEDKKDMAKKDMAKNDMAKKDMAKKMAKKILEKVYDIKHLDEEWNENINYNIIINSIDKGNYKEFEYKLKSDLFKPNEDEDNKKLIQNLLEIDPKKRMTAEKVLNLDMFQKLNFRFENENADMKYKEDDYTKYFNSPNPLNKENFKKYVEEIREKFVGKTLLSIKTE